MHYSDQFRAERLAEKSRQLESAPNEMSAVAVVTAGMM